LFNYYFVLEIKLKNIFGSFVILFSAACSLEVNESVTREEIDTEVLSILSQNSDSLISGAAATELTDVADMPVEGSATFAGVATYRVAGSGIPSINNGANALSEILLKVDFEDEATENVSGSAYNFRGQNGQSISGSLDISNGTIVENTFSADMLGETSITGQSALYSGQLSGSFIGENAEQVIAGADLQTTIENRQVTLLMSIGAAEFDAGPYSVVEASPSYRRLIEVERSSYRPPQTCFVGPRGGTYTLTASGNKNYSGC
jgi:hypothetical protein